MTNIFSFSGKITLCCLKHGATKQLEFVQGQALAAYDFVRGYINEMKSK